MGVPILKLPVVALKVLVDYWNNVELVTVSLLSKRAHWFLKACGKRNVSFFNLEGSEIRYLRKIEILHIFLLESRRKGELPEWNFELSCSVSYDQHISISCRNFIVPVHFETLKNIENFEGTRSNLKIGESFVPVVTTRENNGVEKMRTFWNTKLHGMIVFMDYFKSNFNFGIEELTFARNRSKAIRTIVNHISSAQILVRKVLVSVHPPLSEDDFKFVLENVSATECLSSHLVLNRNFKFNGTIRSKTITIHNGHWFPLRNLTENEVINVNGSDYTKGELKRFLREWASGKFPRVKEVNLATKVSYSDVTKGSLFKRWDKCDKNCARPVKAFRGHGNAYGTVYPDDSGHGYFRMRFYNSELLQ